MLNITKVIENGKAVFALEGRLDMLTSQTLEEELLASLDGLQELTLDLEKLVYISSAGLRVLLTVQEEMGEQGEMKLIHVNEFVMSIFEMTGISDIIPIE